MSLSTFRLWRSVSVGVLCSCVAFSANAGAMSIDFNDTNFAADPSGQVTLNGASATLSESSEVAGIFLFSLPGAPGISASAGATLWFDFDLILPAGNHDDTFKASLIDDQTNSIPGFEFFATSEGTGSFWFDLGDAALVGKTFALQFELNSIDDVYDSMVVVSNLRLLTSEPTTSVPTPSTLVLLCSGLLTMAMLRRRKLVER